MMCLEVLRFRWVIAFLFVLTFLFFSNPSMKNIIEGSRMKVKLFLQIFSNDWLVTEWENFERVSRL